MATSNFHNVNASRIFACEIEEEWDYDLLIENIKDSLEAIDYEEDSGYDPDELRSYGSKVIGCLKACKYYAGVPIEIELSCIVRSGYYAGVNLDWGIRYSTSGDWFDILDQRCIAEDMQYSIDTSWNNALRYADWIIKWIEQTSAEMIAKLEKIYEGHSTPLKVTARFSNGETMYEKA